MEEAVDLQGRPYSHLAFIWTLLAGTFTMSISQSSLSTAYPTLMQYFNIPASTVQWLTTGFMLVMVVMMPVSPWLLNNIQFPILFVSVLALFDVGTFIIYLATSFPLMMVGRVMEAMAVGIMFPSYQTVMLRITPETQRGSVMGMAGLVMGSALAVGPIISGIVLKYTSWQGLFVVFMLVVTVVFLVALKTIKNVMPQHKTHLDYWSVLSSVGFIGLLYVVNQIGKTAVNWGWMSGLLIVSLLAVAYFVWRQFHVATPLLDLRVLKTVNFDLAVLLTGTSYIALIVVTIIFPLYYQEVLGISPFASGMALVPGAVVLSLLNPLTGKLADRIGFKATMLTGMTMIVLGWLWLVLVGGRQSLVAMMVIAALIEGGNAFVMMPAVTLGANSLPDQLISHGTAVITTVRQILGSTGVAVATLVLALVTSSHFPRMSRTAASLAGYQAVFLTFLAVAVVGWIFAAMLRDGRQSTKS
ncbi:MFS transporter [Levilactobacillus brevis]|uniref:MFS transporter n=1 Tax=Levilactobacillus brevis TaxID=1580 RepID=A0AA41EN42_LEVBR|nr:MFS transporter [Levilactobacillus brevis]MBS0946807.1 MFS transporter [Levilactobacillus brevis]MBS0976814.1 MFS transporter [Levilactobacillus brevis]MBS1009780.1 MFS transporter [Levilactobacillus brevis]MCU0200491.1 MFS transporter [Levilactobacillus brevis]ODP93683.1 MFS transporter [Levilactobacillus brevis]